MKKSAIERTYCIGITINRRKTFSVGKLAIIRYKHGALRSSDHFQGSGAAGQALTPTCDL
jgi:hypothetical protein